jgi:hypothetical protein
MTNHHELLSEARHGAARRAEAHRAFADPITRAVLLQRLRAFLGFMPFDPARMSADELATAALPWLEHLLTTRTPLAVVGSGVPAQPARRAPPPPRKPEAPVASRRTWIGIELQDEQGRPCAGEPWRILLADGSERSGWLDDAGRATVHGIEPGTCQVSFPGLDGGEWRAV